MLDWQGKTWIKIISAILIIAFLTYDIAWATDFSSTSQRKDYASRSLFKNKKVDQNTISSQNEQSLNNIKDALSHKKNTNPKDSIYHKDSSNSLKASYINDIANIYIPDTLGKVVDSYSSPDSKATIINIQDLHTNPEASFNLAGILEILIKDYNLNLVCSEGASGEVDTSSVSSFTDKEVREKVAKVFVNSGELTGEEYLSITKYPDLPIWGIEDKDTYFQHIVEFNKIMKFSPDALTFINQLKAALDKLKPKVYSKALLDIDSKETEYKESKIETNAYLDYLLCSRPSLDISNYQNIAIFRDSLEAEKTIDQKKIIQQSQDLLTSLQSAIKDKDNKSEIEGLLTKATLYKDKKISPFSFYSYLDELSRRHLKEDIDKYPDLFNYVSYLRKINSLDSNKLFSEIEELAYEIKDLMSDNSDQKLLTKALRNINFLESFFNLKISNEDLDYYLKDKENFNVAFFKDFLQTNLAKYNIGSFIDFNPDLIDKNLADLENFYELAHKRDIAMFNNATSEIETRKPKLTALITGGFHTQGLTKLLKDNNYSYIVISPYSKTTIDEENYRNLLSGKRKPLKELISELNEKLRAPMGFVNKEFLKDFEKELGSIEFLPDRFIIMLVAIAIKLKKLPIDKIESMFTAKFREHFIGDITIKEDKDGNTYIGYNNQYIRVAKEGTVEELNKPAFEAIITVRQTINLGASKIKPGAGIAQSSAESGAKFNWQVLETEIAGLTNPQELYRYFRTYPASSVLDALELNNEDTYLDLAGGPGTYTLAAATFYNVKQAIYLDISRGNLLLTEHLLRNAPNMTAEERDRLLNKAAGQANVAVILQNISERGVVEHSLPENVSILLGDARNMKDKIEDDSITKLSVTELFNWLGGKEGVKQCIEEILRVVKTGGRIFIVYDVVNKEKLSSFEKIFKAIAEELGISINFQKDTKTGIDGAFIVDVVGKGKTRVAAEFEKPVLTPSSSSQVLANAEAGLKTSEIAKQLGIATSTVEHDFGTMAANLEELAVQDLKYGLKTGVISEKDYLYSELYNIFIENGFKQNTAQRLSQTLAKMKEGSLEILYRSGVINQKEKDVLLNKDLKGLSTLSAAEKKDFARRFKELTDSYDVSLTKQQKGSFMLRLVPLSIMAQLSERYNCSRTVVINAIIRHPDFPVWMKKAHAKVGEIKDSVGGVMNAWAIVLSQGIESADSWVQQAQVKVNTISKIPGIGGLGKAWFIVIAQGLEDVDDWIRGAQLKVDAIKDIVGGASRAWEIVVAQGIPNVDMWMRGAEKKVNAIKDIVGGSTNAWGIVTKHKLAEVDDWVKDAKVIVDRIKDVVGGEYKAWSIAMMQGLKDVDEWVNRAQLKVESIKSIVGSYAWTIVISQGIDDVDGWVAEAKPKVDNIIATYMVDSGTAWQIVVSHGLDKVDSWIEEAKSKVDSIEAVVGARSLAWKIVVSQGTDKADKWTKDAAIKVMSIKNIVGGATNAWQIVIAQGLDKADAWIKEAELKVKSTHATWAYNEGLFDGEYYNPDNMIMPKGRIVDADLIKLLRENKEAQNAKNGSIVESGGYKFYVHITENGQRILISKDIVDNLSDGEFMAILSKALSGVGFEKTKDGLPLIISSLSKSPRLFEDCLQNGFIGINLALLKLYNDNPDQRQYLKILLQVGLEHELRHEFTGKHGKDIEWEFSQIDAKRIVELCSAASMNLKDFVMYLKSKKIIEERFEKLIRLTESAQENIKQYRGDRSGFSSILSGQNVEAVIKFMKKDPGCYIGYGDMFKISVLNKAFTMGIVDKVIVSTILGIADLVLRKYGGGIVRSGGNESALALPSNLTPQQVNNIRLELQLTIAEFISDCYGFVKIEGVDDKNFTEVFDVLNKDTHSLSGVYKDMDGFFLAFDRTKLSSYNLKTACSEALGIVNGILKEKGINITQDTTREPVKIPSPRLNFGIVKATSIPEKDIHVNFGVAIGHAEYIQGIAKDRVGLHGATHETLEGLDLDKFDEKVNQPLAHRLSTDDRKSIAKSYNEKGLSLYFDQIEEDYPVVKREFLLYTIQHISTAFIGTTVLVRGPPDNFYIVTKLQDNSVILMKVELVYEPYGEMKERIDRLIGEAEKTGKIIDDILRQRWINGDGFKIINEYAQDKPDHSRGNRVIFAEAEETYKILEDEKSKGLSAFSNLEILADDISRKISKAIQSEASVNVKVILGAVRINKDALVLGKESVLETCIENVNDLTKWAQQQDPDNPTNIVNIYDESIKDILGTMWANGRDRERAKFLTILNTYYKEPALNELDVDSYALPISAEIQERFLRFLKDTFIEGVFVTFDEIKEQMPTELRAEIPEGLLKRILEDLSRTSSVAKLTVRKEKGYHLLNLGKFANEHPIGKEIWGTRFFPYTQTGILDIMRSGHWTFLPRNVRNYYLKDKYLLNLGLKEQAVVDLFIESYIKMARSLSEAQRKAVPEALREEYNDQFVDKFLSEENLRELWEVRKRIIESSSDLQDLPSEVKELNEKSFIETFSALRSNPETVKTILAELDRAFKTLRQEMALVKTCNGRDILERNFENAMHTTINQLLALQYKTSPGKDVSFYNDMIHFYTKILATVYEPTYASRPTFVIYYVAERLRQEIFGLANFYKKEKDRATEAALKIFPKFYNSFAQFLRWDIPETVPGETLEGSLVGLYAEGIRLNTAVLFEAYLKGEKTIPIVKEVLDRYEKNFLKPETSRHLLELLLMYNSLSRLSLICAAVNAMDLGDPRFQKEAQEQGFDESKWLIDKIGEMIVKDFQKKHINEFFEIVATAYLEFEIKKKEKGWKENPDNSSQKIDDAERPKIIILTDNAGEAVFDMLLVNYLLGLGFNVVIASRDVNVINDMTVGDTSVLVARMRKMGYFERYNFSRLKVISSGSKIFGTSVSDIELGSDFLKEYSDKNTICVIAKGQGNAESLWQGEWSKPFVHILTSKEPEKVLDFTTVPKQAALLIVNPPIQEKIIEESEDMDIETIHLIDHPEFISALKASGRQIIIQTLGNIHLYVKEIKTPDDFIECFEGDGIILDASKGPIYLGKVKIGAESYIRAEDGEVIIKGGAKIGKKCIITDSKIISAEIEDGSIVTRRIVDIDDQGRQRRFRRMPITSILQPEEIMKLGLEPLSINKSLRKSLEANGVKIIGDPSTIYIDKDVEINSGVVIGSNVILKGATKIRKNVELGSYTCLINSEVLEGVKLARLNASDCVFHLGLNIAGIELLSDEEVYIYAAVPEGSKLTGFIINPELEKGEKGIIGVRVKSKGAVSPRYSILAGEEKQKILTFAEIRKQHGHLIDMLLQHVTLSIDKAQKLLVEFKEDRIIDDKLKSKMLDAITMILDSSMIDSLTLREVQVLIWQIIWVYARSPFQIEKKEADEEALFEARYLIEILDKTLDPAKRLELAIKITALSNISIFDKSDGNEKTPIERNFNLILSLVSDGMKTDKLLDLINDVGYVKTDGTKDIVDRLLETPEPERKDKTVLFNLNNAGEVVYMLVLVREVLKLGYKVVLAVNPVPLDDNYDIVDLKLLLEEPEVKEKEFLGQYLAFDRIKIISNGSFSVGLDLGNTDREFFETAKDKNTIMMISIGYDLTLAAFTERLILDAAYMCCVKRPNAFKDAGLDVEYGEGTIFFVKKGDVISMSKDSSQSTSRPTSLAQIGKGLEVTNITDRADKKIAKVVDTANRQPLGEIELTNEPDSQKLTQTLRHLIDNIDTSYKPILEEFFELLKTSPPEFYTYTKLIKNLFGFARSQDNLKLIALHQAVSDNPLAIFHEIGEYLSQSKALTLKLEGNDKLLISINGKDFTITLRDGAALRIVQKGASSPHYLLRALQREMFRKRDIELTENIKLEQHNWEKIAQRDTVTDDNIEAWEKEKAEENAKLTQTLIQSQTELKTSKQFSKNQPARIIIRKLLTLIGIICILLVMLNLKTSNMAYKDLSRAQMPQIVEVAQERPAGYVRIDSVTYDLSRPLDRQVALMPAGTEDLDAAVWLVENEVDVNYKIDPVSVSPNFIIGIGEANRLLTQLGVIEPRSCETILQDKVIIEGINRAGGYYSFPPRVLLNASGSLENPDYSPMSTAIHEYGHWWDENKNPFPRQMLDENGVDLVSPEFIGNVNNRFAYIDNYADDDIDYIRRQETIATTLQYYIMRGDWFRKMIHDRVAYYGGDTQNDRDARDGSRVLQAQYNWWKQQLGGIEFSEQDGEIIIINGAGSTETEPQNSPAGFINIFYAFGLGLPFFLMAQQRKNRPAVAPQVTPLASISRNYPRTMPLFGTPIENSQPKKLARKRVIEKTMSDSTIKAESRLQQFRNQCTKNCL